MASGFEMRVGDAERDAAATELREHFASGRLTQDELNERLDQTFAAKTRGDLNGLFTDLPASRVVGGPTGDPRSFGRTAGQSDRWHAIYGSQTPEQANRPYQDAGDGGSGRSGDYARRTFGTFAISFGLMWVLLVVGLFSIFGWGQRPFGIVLLFAAFAVIRRLVFMIFGRRRGGRGGSRRGGGGGPRRRRR